MVIERLLYSGGDVPVGTDVSELTGVVVTAHYSDGTTAVVTGYEMSGTIEEGKNTIIVTYQRKLASFSVTGVAETGGEGDDGGDAALLYDLDLTKSLVDSIGSVTATLSGDGATRDANGVAFTAGSNKLDLGIKTAPNTELTFYFGECNMTSTISAVIVLGDCIFAHTQGKWQVYDGGYGGGTATDVTLLNNATIQVTIASDGIATIRMGDVEVTSLRSVVSNGSGKLTIGNGSWSAYPINLKRITVKELI